MLSIIVPIYKTEKYLKNCIDSLLEQNLNSFEIILVDDGSPDNSPRICDEYASLDKRIKPNQLSHPNYNVGAPPIDQGQ